MSKIYRIINFNKNFSDKHYIASILKRPKEEINTMMQGYSNSKRKLFRHLTEKYNGDYFYKPFNETEDPNIIIDIINNLKSINYRHFDIIDNLECSFANIQRIFAGINNKSKNLKFVEKFSEILTKDSRPELIAETLESKNSQEYVENFDKYRSYFIINEKNENAIKNLDEMVDNGTFSKAKYDLILKRNNIAKKYHSIINENITLDKLVYRYSEYSRTFLDSIINKYHIKKSELKDGIDLELFNIYKTTNKNNFDIRTKILRTLPPDFNSENRLDEIRELNKLFKTIDENKIARSFVKKFFSTFGNVKSTRKINNVLDNIPHKKLDIFSDNALNIIGQTDEKECVDILKKEIENPFYESENRKRMKKYGYYESPSIFSVIITKIGNLFNKWKYSRIKDDNIENKIINDTLKETSSTKETITNTLNTETSNNNIIIIGGNKPTTPIEVAHKTPEHVVDVKSIIKEETPPQEIKQEIPKQATEQKAIIKEDTNKNIIKPTKPITPNIKTRAQSKLERKLAKQNIDINDIMATPEKIEESKKEFIESLVTKTKEEIVPETKAAKTPKKVSKTQNNKEEIKNGVLSIIQKKLGLKTAEKQRDDFSNNATKLRLNMLPEIFASIAETRKVDKMLGKSKINSSNKDALELFKLINYTNKKYVNYLLKIRNVDNTRMFEVKNIIDMLKKSEAKIAQDKLVNPQYKTKDARQYYNSLYEAKLQQYGKVKRQPKLKKTA